MLLFAKYTKKQIFLFTILAFSYGQQKSLLINIKQTFLYSLLASILFQCLTFPTLLTFQEKIYRFLQVLALQAEAF